ncbi:MAG: helix-turn-helix transcriptional regulator [Eubacteriales bacterium]|nr:helix-turn-helix transcriptional regulator [Eubacteriales bacterium]
MKHEIGIRIRELREKNGYTREELAEYMEMSDKFIYDIESGKKGFSATTLLRFRKAFQVSCDYILLGYGEEVF